MGVRVVPGVSKVGTHVGRPGADRKIDRKGSRRSRIRPPNLFVARKGFRSKATKNSQTSGTKKIPTPEDLFLVD